MVNWARYHTSDMIDAEASAWLARLQGPRRTTASEKAFRTWLAADSGNQSAFERATEIWDMLPGAIRPDSIELPRKNRWPSRFAMASVAAAIIATILIVHAYITLSTPIVHSTAPGEVQSVALEDGTLISLNTDSQVTVLYSADERRIRLDRGEAMFEVKRNAQRPFIVAASDKEVRALGTIFVVRQQLNRLGVTLIKGSVEVSRKPWTKRVRVAVLRPGERLTFIGQTGVAIDHPPAELATAWRKGEIIFDDVSLFEAAEELNRYGIGHISVTDPNIASLRVSGIFTTHDPLEFVHAIAALYKLQVEQKGKELMFLPETRVHSGSI